ncbi:MAG: molybdopterin molybdotransferase MoeA [Verrucomicrobiales bacterium]
MKVGSGEAIRIFTGAPLGGADAVVMQEDTEAIDSGRAVKILDAAAAGDFIRRAGADLCAGQKAVAAGEPITAARIGLLASVGLTEIHAGALPRLTVLSTGDELVDPGSRPLRPGEIFNSNAAMLAAQCRALGFGAPRCEHVPDQPEATRAALSRAIEGSDFLIISGGVSVGDHDCVKPALAALGVEPEFWRVRIKPGKPLLFTKAGRCHVFGLPGNPVSSFVTFALFAGPAIRRWMRASDAFLLPPSAPARLAHPAENQGDRPHYLRGELTPGGDFHPTGAQQSNALYGLSRANALVRLDPGAALAAGALVEAINCYS